MTVLKGKKAAEAVGANQAIDPRIIAPSYYFKEVFTLEETSEYTGIGSGTLYVLIHEGRIPFYKPLGKKIYFKRSELDKFMLRNRHPADYEVHEAADAKLN
jgi:excisionase family DNA binding protein